MLQKKMQTKDFLQASVEQTCRSTGPAESGGDQQVGLQSERLPGNFWGRGRSNTASVLVRPLRPLQPDTSHPLVPPGLTLPELGPRLQPHPSWSTSS